ncbi:piggyBac transposable element-derived protein 4-like [Penaeus monodon]|uniref:piggyBac transposable element-derived protein 4-like n=1 Tax=Penaeus monodon TaxID=6687 RepID=UPI0018A7185A|nr:piggyBac transposable element-derived protein 4-like [Penaeus monodon]
MPGQDIAMDELLWKFHGGLASRPTTQPEGEVLGVPQLNRKFMPKDLVMRRKDDGDYCSSKTGMLALVWKDRSNVTMLSTVHTAAMDGDKPLVVKDYNVSMKGVKMASYYPMTRRSKVWYWKVFFFLYDMAIVNAWAVHRALGSEESQRAFRVGLASLSSLGQFRGGPIL